MLFDDIVFHVPAAGVYKLTFSTELLESITSMSQLTGVSSVCGRCDGNDPSCGTI